MPPPPEVLPGRLREEMPLAPARRPRVPRYRPLGATCGAPGAAVAVALGREVAVAFRAGGGPGALSASPSPSLCLSPFLQREVPAQTEGLLRTPMPPLVTATCSHPGKDCPAGDGDSSLPTL